MMIIQTMSRRCRRRHRRCQTEGLQSLQWKAHLIVRPVNVSHLCRFIIMYYRYRGFVTTYSADKVWWRQIDVQSSHTRHVTLTHIIYIMRHWLPLLLLMMVVPLLRADRQWHEVGLSIQQRYNDDNDNTRRRLGIRTT